MSRQKFPNTSVYREISIYHRKFKPKIYRKDKTLNADMLRTHLSKARYLPFRCVRKLINKHANLVRKKKNKKNIVMSYCKIILVC